MKGCVVFHVFHKLENEIHLHDCSFVIALASVLMPKLMKW